jgi:hypothetical protein
MVREPGAAPRAVRSDPEVLHQKALLEDPLQRPPDALYVLRAHGLVRVLVVGPVAHAFAHGLEGIDVAAHRLPAPLVELRDAVPLDVRLASEAELLLHLELHREAMAVPAGHPRDVVALHGLEPREDVLEYTRLDVVGARHAVGGGRAFVERPLRPGGSGFQAALEDLALAPQRDDVAVHRGQVDVRREWLVARHLDRTSAPEVARHAVARGRRSAGDMAALLGGRSGRGTT